MKCFTIVITTHSMLDVEVLADRLIILENGIIECQGKINFVKNLCGKLKISFSMKLDFKGYF